MSEKEQKTIKFSEIREAILTALQEKIKKGELQLSGRFALIEGFFFSTLQEKFPGIQIGGTGIPIIAIVHEQTGEIRYFALKKILPNLDI